MYLVIKNVEQDQSLFGENIVTLSVNELTTIKYITQYQLIIYCTEVTMYLVCVQS